MDALIQELTASGPLEISAPLAFEARTGAVPVSCPHVQRPTDASRANDVECLVDGRRVAVIEAECQHAIRPLRRPVLSG